MLLLVYSFKIEILIIKSKINLFFLGFCIPDTDKLGFGLIAVLLCCVISDHDAL